MARYTPDYQYREAKEYIDNLEPTPENILIKYYIQKQQETIDKQSIRLKEYKKFFETLSRFLPNPNPVFGGR